MSDVRKMNDPRFISFSTSMIFLIIDLVILCFHCYFHYLIRRMILRKDSKKANVSIIQTLLSCYSLIVPFTFLIVFTYLNLILPFAYPASEVFGGWFCFSYEYFAHSTGLYLGTFSLFTAGMKYWFIVHNAKARVYGEEKAKRQFWILHLSLPFFMAAMNSVSNGNKDQIYVVNICWKDPPNQVYLNETIEEASLTDRFLCRDRSYDLQAYIGENASNYVEPLLRSICGSISVFYILFCSNMGELIIYWLIFKYLNRLHDNGERKSLAPKSEGATIKRRRGRHRLRKVLLALDFIVECSGGCFIFIVIFVGDESLLQQHILLTIGSFIYGVPIPLAYLLNETRVRNIIIKKGWIEGFISIFHSPEKIKQLERERIMQYLHPETSRNHEVYVSQKVDNCCKVNYIRKNTNETNIENEISENNEIMKNINFHQEDGAKKNNVDATETNKLASREAIMIDLSNQLDKNSKLLMCSDTSFIESFFEQSEKVIELLCDENFKIFSRKYILNTILKLLKTNAKETDYKKHFGHLCCLESFPEEQKDSESKLNFIISLMNVWFLEKSQYCSQPFQENFKDEETKIIRPSYDNERKKAREKIINKLIIDVSCDEQYIEHLKLLYDLEDEEDEEELVYGW